MNRRWYRRCGADFIHGTMNLSLEEKGAYSLCLDLIYDRGGAIPDDARWLSGICNVSIRKWGALRQRLLDLGKLTLSDGRLSNARAELEIVSSELSSRKLSESGAKGGRKRAENEANAKENNHLDEAGLKHIREDKIREEKIREEKKEDGGADAPGSKYFFEGSMIRLIQTHFDRWAKAYHTIRDLNAELISLDAWWQEQPEEKRKKWFHATARMLNRKHQENLEAIETYDPERITV